MEARTPHAPLKPCAVPGCPLLVAGRYCAQHTRDYQHAIDSRRGNSTERGYGSRWQTYRRGYLQRHPLCVECLRESRTVAATVVDHIVPHRGDMRLFWDAAGNWKSSCKPCHDRATALYDGGFGLPVRPKPTTEGAHG